MKKSMTKIALSLVLSTVALPVYGMDRAGKDISIKQVVLGLVGLAWIGSNAYDLYKAKNTEIVKGKKQDILGSPFVFTKIQPDVEEVSIEGSPFVFISISNPSTNVNLSGSPFSFVFRSDLLKLIFGI